MNMKEYKIPIEGEDGGYFLLSRLAMETLIELNHSKSDWLREKLDDSIYDEGNGYFFR